MTFAYLFICTTCSANKCAIFSNHQLIFIALNISMRALFLIECNFVPSLHFSIVNRQKIQFILLAGKVPCNLMKKKNLHIIFHVILWIVLTWIQSYVIKWINNMLILIPNKMPYKCTLCAANAWCFGFSWLIIN